jgi:release factor glutamine methyltransferase
VPAPDTLVPAATTLRRLQQEIAARLKTAFAAAGRTGTPDLDARLLVAVAAGIDPAAVPLRPDLGIDPDIAQRALAFAERRIAGEPVARILGRKEFWGLDLVLSAATLVPRPDTETVVEAALAFAAHRNADRMRILDLGTGSGAILLALLSELPHATGIGSDVAPAAIATALTNARHLRLTDRAAFFVGDWMGALAGGRFDAIVANPPYIPSATIEELDVEVRAHDPRVALDGGEDGLGAVRTILSDLGRVLVPSGAAFIEIGAGQGEAVTNLAASHSLKISLVRDLAGIDRVAIVTN